MHLIFSAYFLAFFAGFISLSQEILWVRLFGFANHSIPQAFSYVLIFYLLGIAIGARVGKKICLSKENLWNTSGVILIASSFFDLVSPWIYAGLMQIQLQLIYGGLLILLTAFFKSTVFPIVHQLGIPLTHSKTGWSLSKVYVSNILGATLGPIITGLFFLNYFSTQQCYALSAVFTCMLGIWCLKKKFRMVFLGFIFLFGFIWTKSPNLLIASLAEKKDRIKHIFETREGIVTLYQNKNQDMVFGGNVYDGNTNLDPNRNTNGINRILVLSALQDHPEHVLMLGLSIGSWLKLLTSFPGIKKIDVVEINPGYVKAIQFYPHQLSALHDPRVHLEIDDGRHWLKTHPDKQYDLIVMNTTYHWRAYSANLLSYEFLTVLKTHLKKEGILAYNTTSSPDALKTAAQVFSHAYLYSNFVFAGDFDWRAKLHEKKAEKKLTQLLLDGKPLFQPHSEKLIQHFLNIPLVSVNELEIKFKRPLEVITDKNLITEYKYGLEL